jgi:hypothetical protein
MDRSRAPLLDARPLSWFGCSGSLPVDPLAALGIFRRAGG